MTKARNLRDEIAQLKSDVADELRELKQELAKAEAAERLAKAYALGHFILAHKPDVAESFAKELTGKRERALFGLPPLEKPKGTGGASGVPADGE